MATLEKAIEIAAIAHAGVKDKQGQPYILHCITVMMGVELEDAKKVAVLHDVVEDTDVTLHDLRAQGFSETVLEALDLVTHRKDKPYSDYVISCKKNQIARLVKLSDLRHNTSIDRILLRSDRLAADSARLQKYVLSYRYLTDALTEEEYRAQVSPFE